MKKNITIYDTTLRDGAQSVGISFSTKDKLRIAASLDRLKIDYIEGGWPGSNPKDDQFFKDIRNIELSHSKITAFGSTRRKDTTVKEDLFVQSLIDSQADIITIVGKTWDFQVTEALNIGLNENLDLIYDTIAYLKDKNREVFLDAEHFFDGFKTNPDYSFECIEKTIKAGADMIVLCDTNGGTLPFEVEKIVSAINEKYSIPIGVHFHNDTGVAVANSLSAILVGAVSVQGTANGYGERCGNCNLMTLIPNIIYKMDYTCHAEKSIMHLTEISKFISETANLSHNDSLPYVGAHAFAHKGGLHVSALKKNTKTYEHIEPELTGNKRQIMISELSGKSNIELKAKELGIEFEKSNKHSKEILSKIKKMEDLGFQFETAEASFELIIREATGEYKPFFKLKGFRIITEKDESGEIYCEGTIKVEVDNKIDHTAANGEGPVEALDNALRKALLKFYPEIKDMHLSDYKVRVLNEQSGTESGVRVLIDHMKNGKNWSTIGVSSNIIEASWQALVDGIEYMLFKKY
jgi:2-isopropylmalate synthase